MAIKDEISRLQQAKQDFKTKLIEKGVTVSDDELISDYPPKLDLIKGGSNTTDATATANEIRKGFTAYVASGKVEGAIEDYDGSFEGGIEISGGGATVTAPGDWQGTPVPNSGVVEKIYFNTNLSVEEVVALLSQLTYVDDSYYFLFETEPFEEENDNATGLYINYFSKEIVSSMGIDSDVYMVIANVSTEINQQIVFININPSLIGASGSIGWNINYLEFNTIGVNANVGHQNDLLSSLFSTTPFTQSSGEQVLLEGDYDGSTIEAECTTINVKLLLEQKKLPLAIEVKGGSGGYEMIKLNFNKSELSHFENTLDTYSVDITNEQIELLTKHVKNETVYPAIIYMRVNDGSSVMSEKYMCGIGGNTGFQEEKVYFFDFILFGYFTVTIRIMNNKMYIESITMDDQDMMSIIIPGIEEMYVAMLIE